MSGTHAAEFSFDNAATYLIPPGGDAIFAATFTPDGPGIREAVLTLTSNDFNSPLAMSLTGTGADSGGAVSYGYDDNGNMTERGGQTLTWDAENRLATVTEDAYWEAYTYDGDGRRVKKTTSTGSTIVYPNKYYVKNVTTGVETRYYYLGDRLVAFEREGNLRYVHQDHLGSTAVVTDATGDVVAQQDYASFGETRGATGTLDTERQFTGQRLDETGLYFYKARYYDATLGRFVSPDSIVPEPGNTQAWNRYAYVINNPLKYTDPTGHFWETVFDVVSVAVDIYHVVQEPSRGNWTALGVDTAGLFLPFVPSAAGWAYRAGDNALSILKRVDAAHQGLKPIRQQTPLSTREGTLGSTRS